MFVIAAFNEDEYFQVGRMMGTLFQDLSSYL